MHYIHSETAAKQIAEENKLDIKWKESNLRGEVRKDGEGGGESMYDVRKKKWNRKAETKNKLWTKKEGLTQG